MFWQNLKPRETQNSMQRVMVGPVLVEAGHGNTGVTQVLSFLAAATFFGLDLVLWPLKGQVFEKKKKIRQFSTWRSIFQFQLNF